MAELPNQPTLLAIIMMGIAFVGVLIVIIPFYVLYFRRRKKAALAIAVAFTFWDLGALAVFIGALLSYLYVPVGFYGYVQYARYGINIGYIFSSLSNIFIVIFVAEVFSQYPLFRRTKKVIPIINGIFNGVTIGMILSEFIESAKTTADYTEKFNPAYPLPQTVYFLILTVFSFSLLLAFCVKARTQASLRWEKAGFSFIIASSIAGILIYLSFTLDLVVQEINPTLFGSGYTVFNIMGWIFAVIMANLAYLGYVMPKGLRERLKKSEVN